MKFTLKSLLAGSALVAISFGATSAQAATNSASANANATIVSAVTITKNTDLNFGTAVSGASAGSVVIAPTAAGTQLCTTVICTGGGNTSAQFTLAGAATYTAVMTIPATATLTSGANTMTATLSNSLVANKLVLTGTAADTFYVGGSLAVAASQATGSYAGTFTVTVAYQ
jgi:hypothetical protein